MAVRRIGGAIVAGAFAVSGASLLSAQSRPAATKVDTAFLQRLLVAEDARGTGTNGITPLLAGLDGQVDPRIRLAAVRGVGRLQRADLAPRIVALLDDPSRTMRAEAANALAESMQNVWGGGSVGSPRAAAADSARAALDRTRSALASRVETETDPTVLGVLARSLGRLPYSDTASARAAEVTILRAADAANVGARSSGRGSYDVANALYILARNRRSLGDLSLQAVELLRRVAHPPSPLDARRAALLALGSAGVLDSGLTIMASRDADWQIRRLALTSVRSLDQTLRDDVVRRALHDPVANVRIDAMRLVRAPGAAATSTDCAPLIAATRDPSPLVALAAIDALAGPCVNRAARDGTLRAIAATLPAGDPPRTAGHVTWHAAAHAIVALARTDSSAARALLPRFVAHPRQHVRAYAARAAAILGDGAVLTHLAADANHNVQEAAVVGLQQVRAHDADTTYLAVLGSRGYQAVLAAAKALPKTTVAHAVDAFLDALDRLTADGKETSRDPRVAVLARIGELGSAANAPRVERYLTDFDTTVAHDAAAVISRWTGQVVAAHPVPHSIRDEPLARLFLLSEAPRLRVTMATGGVFTIRLDVTESPASVARVVRLAASGYYNGLTWHRVVPNFVIQGGSPDENEYVGDGPFMRDELDLRPHHRGTVGISSRGRDTGDGQLFVNLVDNPRLEHTNFLCGEVVSGMNVVDGILEGDVIKRVDVLGWK